MRIGLGEADVSNTLSYLNHKIQYLRKAPGDSVVSDSILHLNVEEM